MNACWTTYESPIGPLTLVAREGKLRHLYFPGKEGRLNEELRNPADLAEATGQLEQYFAGERQTFELPLDLLGSPFQRQRFFSASETALASCVCSSSATCPTTTRCS